MRLGIRNKDCFIRLLSLLTTCAGLGCRSNALRTTKGFRRGSDERVPRRS